MSWYDDTNCETAAMAERCSIARAVDLEFPSGNVRLHTRKGTLSIGGNTFLGAGDLATISDTPERASLTTERWTYGISGIDPSVIPESEIDDSFGGEVIEYEVYLNPETHAVIGYEIRREGTINRVRRRDGRSPLIEVGVDTRLAILELKDGWRWVTEHQEKFFSGDLGCDFARNLDSEEIIWGGHRTSGNSVIDLANHFAGN